MGYPWVPLETVVVEATEARFQQQHGACRTAAGEVATARVVEIVCVVAWEVDAVVVVVLPRQMAAVVVVEGAAAPFH